MADVGNINHEVCFKTPLGLTQFILSASQRRVFACGNMVLFDHMFVFFALVERKKDKHMIEEYHAAAGKNASL